MVSLRLGQVAALTVDLPVIHYDPVAVPEIW